MLDELRPLGLTDVARRLELDPFEVVVLLVRGGVIPEALRLTEDHVEKLTSYSGIEFWWPAAVQPIDTNARRALVRSAVGQLLERNLIGDASTRIDNLWRGLPEAEASMLQRAVSAMVEAQILMTTCSATGWSISVNPDAQPIAVRLAANGDAPAAVAATWAE